MEQKKNNEQKADVNSVSKPIAKPHVVSSLLSINEFKQEIFECGFEEIKHVLTNDIQTVFKKSSFKSFPHFYVLVILSKLSKPFVIIRDCLFENNEEHSSIVVNGYDLHKKGDFKNLISRLTLVLSSIQEK